MNPQNQHGTPTPRRSPSMDGFTTPRRSTMRRPAPRRIVLPPTNSPVHQAQQIPIKPAQAPTRSTAPAPEVHIPRNRTVPIQGDRRKAAKPQRSKRKTFFKRFMIILLLAGLGAGLFFGFKIYRSAANLTGNNNPFNLLSAFKPVALKNADGRVNMLVAGNSADDAGHNGGKLTDSIMLLSLDTKNNTAFMLSIPRDLLVDIPGGGTAKINSAYVSGGMDALEQVVEDISGQPIHYHALVNYSAFRDLVDAVGGITITINSKDPRGIYDPNIDYTSRNCCALAKYPNGPATLNGKQALNLARARGDPTTLGIAYGFPNSDFDRTENQRKMLLAIKDKVSDSSIIANPLKITKLIDAVGNNVTTNLQINEMQSLYFYMKQVETSKINSYNINNLRGEATTMLRNDSFNGQSVLIPANGQGNYTAIQMEIKRLLSNDPVVREAASVVVMNGTETTGLAGSQRTVLTAKGIVATTADAPKKQATTTITVNPKTTKPSTLAYLKQKYGATETPDAKLTALYPTADFIVILGQDSVAKLAPSSATAP